MAADYLAPGRLPRTLARLALAQATCSPTLAAIPMARPAEIVRRLARLRTHVPTARPSVARVVAVFTLCGAFAIALSGLQLVSAAAVPNPTTAPLPGARVLHFPADRSLGGVSVQDASLARRAKASTIGCTTASRTSGSRSGPPRAMSPCPPASAFA